MNSRLAELQALEPWAAAQLFAARGITVDELDPDQWRSLIEVFASDLIDRSVQVKDEEWAIYSKAYEFLIEQGRLSGTIDHIEGLVRALNLSSALFRRKLLNLDMAFLQPSGLVEVVRSEITMSAKEAIAMSTHWRDLDISTIRRLRMAKNLLTPAVVFIDVLPEVSAAWLRSWSEALPLLP